MNQLDLSGLLLLAAYFLKYSGDAYGQSGVLRVIGMAGCGCTAPWY